MLISVFWGLREGHACGAGLGRVQAGHHWARPGLRREKEVGRGGRGAAGESERERYVWDSLSEQTCLLAPSGGDVQPWVAHA